MSYLKNYDNKNSNPLIFVNVFKVTKKSNIYGFYYYLLARIF